jgi:hypothetical protein
MFWTINDEYLPDPFEYEAQLESAIAEVAPALFGPNRIYLNVKKLIGTKGKTKNIPDGYLIDLASKKDPRLFVVENELGIHDPLNHVAVQILEFSLSFDSSPFKLKAILKETLKADKSALALCESYATNNGFENVDYLLERLIRKDNAFNALVIIDKLDDELETLLLSRFKFPVEILTLRRFRTREGETAYEFDPFLADLAGPALETESHAAAGATEADPAELDTVVVPALDDGFKETFIAENRWWAIRIHSSMVSRIKYIAAYRTAPISAITHVAMVKDIQRWKDTSKYVLNFTEPAKEIGPIKLVPKPNGTVKAPQAPRYTSYGRLMRAKNMDEAF